MRLAIVGSREINDPEILMTALKKVPHLEQVTEIVSGGANGVDTLAKQYAVENGLKLTEFLPDYKSLGRGAPLARNTQIVEYADIVLAIPIKGSSRGTRDSMRKAEKFGKRLIVHEIDSAIEVKTQKNVSLKMEHVQNSYSKGDEVLHDKFGKGKVTGIEGNIVIVKFEMEGVKKLSCSFKGLHKV